MKYKQLSIWILLFTLYQSKVQAQVYVSHEINPNPTIDSFSICYGHSCETIKQISLTKSQWSEVTSIFSPQAKSAQAERALIAKAIAKMEDIVGIIAGTSHDLAFNYKGLFSDEHQMDCIDESTNSTNYLIMMQNQGLLKWHTVENTKTRGYLIFGWPHTTAVIKDTQQQDWAVDSWFYDNGIEPAILTIEKWQSGWEPEKKSQ